MSPTFWPFLKKVVITSGLDMYVCVPWTVQFSCSCSTVLALDRLQLSFLSASHTSPMHVETCLEYHVDVTVHWWLLHFKGAGTGSITYVDYRYF